MKCPVCGAGSRVIETRVTLKGRALYRRRVCTFKHKFTTHEKIVQHKERMPHAGIQD